MWWVATHMIPNIWCHHVGDDHAAELRGHVAVRRQELFLRQPLAGRRIRPARLFLRGAGIARRVRRQAGGSLGHRRQDGGRGDVPSPLRQPPSRDGPQAQAAQQRVLPHRLRFHRVGAEVVFHRRGVRHRGGTPAAAAGVQRGGGGAGVGLHGTRYAVPGAEERGQPRHHDRQHADRRLPARHAPARRTARCPTRTGTSTS